MRQSCSTPERDAFLRANWANTRLSLADLAASLNAMQGHPLAGGTTVSAMAKRLGLPSVRRPAAAAPTASQVRAESAQEAGPNLHGMSGVKGTSLTTSDGGAYLPADNGDREAAEQLFAAGMFARAVSAELKVDIGQVSCWYFAWKKRQPAGQVAA
ncbi:hypothetical protein SAMN02745194_03111 [Roseomonas rosea]|uniref:Uncharacterized protein n=1 Tax=Muricoccus roseus TaxID=198092 RepID=A0A1M6LB52_9PROT|nr:hypothetical protein [Roseomonas rosea]SHJ68395.1 hypothetical protein SAMN02745194_03111 [Roseomonas rosea]